MIDQIRSAIENASSVALLAHTSEDPDALGSIYAMREVLRDAGKEAVCYVSRVPETRLSFMGEDYKVWEEGMPFSHDLCISLDCGSLDRLDTRQVIFDRAAVTLNIDHHATNTGFAKINFVDIQAAATGEILYGLFRKLGLAISEKAAGYLYTAIVSDTGCFKYSNTTPRTMQWAGELLAYPIDHAEIARLLFDSVSLNVLRLQGAAIDRIKSYAGGKISLICVEENLLSQYGVAEGEASDFVDIPRRVRGTEVAVELKIRDGKIRVSLRSNGKADVSKVAVALGGGGHVKAAGATLDCETMEEAETLLVERLTQSMREDGIL